MEKAIYSSDGKALCEWLKEQRIKSALTMRELGLLMNTHHSIIGRIELGERRLDVVEWIQYCEALEANPFECLNIMLKNRIQKK